MKQDSTDADTKRKNKEKLNKLKKRKKRSWGRNSEWDKKTCSRKVEESKIPSRP